jgi:hypothetical protein
MVTVRRGVDGSMLSPLEEVWDPASRHAVIDVEQRADQAAPAPSRRSAPLIARMGP